MGIDTGNMREICNECNPKIDRKDCTYFDNEDDACDLGGYRYYKDKDGYTERSALAFCQTGKLCPQWRAEIVDEANK